MKYREWAPFYLKILDEFGYSTEEDIRVAKILETYLKIPDLEQVNEKIYKKEVAIYGAGPSLDSIKNIPNSTTIASDGATSFFIDKGIIPDIIITDLDGEIEDIIKANRKGSIIFIHAHGDNEKEIKEYTSRFEKPRGTTQSKQFGNILNFGGFTDGDRAVYLAEHFKPKRIFLYGMDFNSGPGKYSYSKDSNIKRKKLKWAEYLITQLTKKTKIPIVHHKSE